MCFNEIYKASPRNSFLYPQRTSFKVSALRFSASFLRFSSYVIQHLPSCTQKVLKPSHVFKSLCFLTRWPSQCYHLSSPSNHRSLLLVQHAIINSTSKIHPQAVINQNTLTHRIDIATWLIVYGYVSELDVPSAHDCHMIVLSSLCLLLFESISLIHFWPFFSYPESKVGNERRKPFYSIILFPESRTQKMFS